MSTIIKGIGREDITTKILDQLEALYAQAYYNGHMLQDLRDDIARRPEIFRLFLAATSDDPAAIVGARLVEAKHHDFIDYHGHAPVHGKRFCVDPAYRSHGIGKALLEAGKSYTFDELGLDVTFGESNEIGALAMYGREGALYYLPSIEQMSHRNTPEQNIRFFSEFLTNPLFRSYRLPKGDGVQFIYCRNEEIRRTFKNYGYAAKDELLRRFA